MKPYIKKLKLREDTPPGYTLLDFLWRNDYGYAYLVLPPSTNHMVFRISDYFSQYGIKHAVVTPDDKDVNIDVDYFISDRFNSEVAKDIPIVFIEFNNESNPNFKPEELEGFEYLVLKMFGKSNIERGMLTKQDIQMIEPISPNEQLLPLHITNQGKETYEITKWFLRLIATAKKELDISSGWIGYNVITPAFKSFLKRQLDTKPELKIIIRYGMNQNGFSENDHSDELADELRRYLSEFGERFSIEKEYTHYKVVLCDDLYKLEGSMNYLSGYMDTISSNHWKEATPIGHNPEEIKKIRGEHFE